ncbi:unnamed protein product [Effrenium voratum]|uniref:Copia protein n=1 Tax=Effrenium voratum TaxID=2562239 RepID=A0AA36IDP8_9DINO|nr:unnamed protein product [Effrenium voratum]
MEVMRRRRSGQVSPGREVEESRALAGGELVADEGEDPEMGEPMEGDDTLEVHSADGRASTREASTARSARPGMDDEPLVERESSSTASREYHEVEPFGIQEIGLSGDEEEPVRTPLKAAEGEAAAKRNRARAFIAGGEGPPEEGWRNKGPSGGGGEDWDGAGSAGDKGRPATPEDRLEGELSRVMIEEYGAVNMNLAEALRQRNELRHKVEQLELEKIVVEAEAEQNRRMAELWESRARQAEKHVELLTDQITVLEQRPQQFHTPQQEEEPQPPRPETPPPPPPGIRSKRQKLEMTPGGTRVPQVYVKGGEAGCKQTEVDKVEEAVESFAEYLQAESETAELAKGGKEAAPKVKAMGGAGKEEAGAVVEEEMEEVAVEETGGKDKLMAEATQLLKSLRMKKLKAARLSKIGECQSWGLLDGGATHALRQARKGETDRMVELADGREVVMQMTEGHTLICKEATQVIVPLGALYLLGYRIRWEEGICCIEHASRGPLPVRMRQFCPEVPTEVALRLVEELEEFNKGLLRRAATAATKSMRKPDVKKGLCGRVAEAWKKGEMEKVKGEFEQLFPEVPVALLERALGTGEGRGIAWNRAARRRHAKATGLILHLFAGKSAKKFNYGQWDREVIAVDILSGQDLLEEDTFGYLAGLAAEGRTEGVMGGPPCRTYSYCRHFEPGPYPVRGRGEERFGYEELSDAEARKVEGDSVSMLRMWILAVLANGGRELVGLKAWMVKEHPEDPRSFVSEEEWEKAKARGGEPPSIWDWPEVTALEEVLGLIRVKFDQGAMGHIKRKPTMLLTSIKDLRQLDEWAPGSVAALDEEGHRYLLVGSYVTAVAENMAKEDEVEKEAGGEGEDPSEDPFEEMFDEEGALRTIMLVEPLRTRRAAEVIAATQSMDQWPGGGSGWLGEAESAGAAAAAGANANLWHGAALQAVEIRNRKIMREMGSPQLQLPVFGQKVVVKKRRWKREAWEAITQNATYVGPCPDMTFGLRVMDQGGSIYTVSQVVPEPRDQKVDIPVVGLDRCEQVVWSQEKDRCLELVMDDLEMGGTGEEWAEVEEMVENAQRILIDAKVVEPGIMWEVTKVKEKLIPVPKEIERDGEDEEQDMEMVRRGGPMTWESTCWASSKLEFGAAAEGHGENGEYVYERGMNTVEVYADAGFGPDGGRSQQGVIVCYGGCPIHWTSTRQPFVARSTAEAELLAAMEGVPQGEAWAEIIADMEDRKVASVWDRAGIDVEGRDQLKSLKLVMMQALGSSRLRALAEMMGMKMGESDAIPEKDENLVEVGEGNAAKVRVVHSIEHERGLKVLTGITCIMLADAAGMEDEEASREELLFWTALLVAVVAAWEALKWSAKGRNGAQKEEEGRAAVVLQTGSRKRKPKEKIGPEKITVMRTSGPVFVLGGDYTVGSRSGLREFVGFTIFKKKQEVGS